MEKAKCARCGYREFTGSLHIHHLDHDNQNNNTKNLIVLCSNCHLSLHHNKWNISDIGFNVILNKRKRKSNKWCKKKTERMYLAEITDLKKEIENGKYRISEITAEHLYEQHISLMTYESAIEYIGLFDHGFREDLILIDKVFRAYVSSLAYKRDGWSGYKAGQTIEDIIIEKAKKIKIPVVET